MHICEFRIPMPLALEEYRIGQLYSTLKCSLNETGGGEGVEIAVNKPYKSGQYTEKIYHLKSKVPAIVKAFAPTGSLILHEKSWNSFPTGYTRMKNDEYMKENFFIKIKTNVQADDKGKQENIFKLNDEELEIRKVVIVDIANDEVAAEDNKDDENPQIFKSKDNPPRGPLGKNWIDNAKPILCVYKLVKCKFKWWGFQNMVESKIISVQKRFFTVYHRRIWCWLDEWIKLTIEDIRKLEAKTKDELEKKRKEGEAHGVKEL